MKSNNTILVTGGSGSFGKHFIKYALKKKLAKKIIVYSRDEYKHYEMCNELSINDIAKTRFFIGDIRDLSRLNIAFNNVDIVVHAAAIKQVEAAEYNPMECIKTNVIGAQNIINASRNNNVKKVIALSTDKASDPVNLYGASKLVADKLFTAANNYMGKNKTRFSIVRYGNVLNSRGSIVPFFRKLLIDKKKIPLTHNEMSRFWITLDQAVNFVNFCISEMRGGEIFVPKLPTIKIIDLIKALDSRAKIKNIGIRPGEKIHEVLISNNNFMDTIEFRKYLVIKPSIKFFGEDINYSINKNNEKGKFVNKLFQYDSNSNKDRLNIDSIKKFLSK